MISHRFVLRSAYSPAGDQPHAIKSLTESVESGARHTILLGVTGSGKTFTVANVIARIGRPALVIAPNKTLAAQLFHEFKAFFPENAVEYFVSYYDYYQPEAYIPQSDTYIEKDSSINDFIDRLRHSATLSLLTRRDVIIVASVSCIYGLGSPEDYQHMHLYLRTGESVDRDQVIRRLSEMLYVRNEIDFHRGTFRARGDILDIFPAHEEERAVRIEFFDEEIEAIKFIDPVTGQVIGRARDILVYPCSHYVTSKTTLKRAIESIREELRERLQWFEARGRLLEAQRLEQRTTLDLEMLEELGYCHGIENYSRHLSGRLPGQPPYTLLDYFPDDMVVFIDESHITIPQIRGMYAGDRSRKETLVEYGFRLPSALDNRPLRFDEFEERCAQLVYISATPGPYELQHAGDRIVEQIIRPTGLVDPRIEIRPASTQVDDLVEEVRRCREEGTRALVTTLTKRMAEDLTDYLEELGFKVAYLHSDIQTVERSKIIRELREGVHDVLVGINLLREGLDMPEVSLVAVLDADKEGFLRSERSLIQVAGRAARNVEGLVILYADEVTGSIRRAVEEMERRRKRQMEYNRKHGIVPRSVVKDVDDTLTSLFQEEREAASTPELHNMEIRELEKRMRSYAKALEFEKAAQIRDLIAEMKQGGRRPPANAD